VAAIHLIRFGTPEERQQAIMVFLDVPATRIVLPGQDMVVTNAHVAALERAGIPFGYLSQTWGNGKVPATAQP
jgi:hypothetical protein